MKILLCFAHMKYRSSDLLNIPKNKMFVSIQTNNFFKKNNPRQSTWSSGIMWITYFFLLHIRKKILQLHYFWLYQLRRPLKFWCFWGLVLHLKYHIRCDCIQMVSLCIIVKKKSKFISLIHVRCYQFQLLIQ